MTCIFLVFQDAINNLISEAKENAQQNLKDALRDLIQTKLSSLSSHGDITLSEESIQLTVDPAATPSLFSFLSGGDVSLPITLEQVIYCFESLELTVDTRGYGSQTIIPNVLDLENIVLSFTVNLQDVNTLRVTFSGDWVFGSTLIPIEAVYNHGSGNTDATAQISDINVDLQLLANDVAGIPLPSALRGSATIPDLTVSGTVTSSGDIQLIVSTTDGDTQVYIIYTKEAGSTAKKAIAVEFSNIQLSSVFSDLTDLDISDIPYFGSAVVPTIGLTFSTAVIEDLPEDVFANSLLLSTNGNSVEEDLTAFILFDFTNDPIKLHYSGGTPTFVPANPGSLSVNSLISAIPSFDLSSIPLPPGVSGLLQLSIDTFVLDIQARSIQIAASYPDSLTFFDGFLTVENPMVIIEGSHQGVKLDVDGDLSISGSGFDVTIERDEESGDYVLAAQADVLPITGLINQFQSEVLPSELNSLINSLPFFSFSINDPSLSFPLSSSPLQVQLGGTPVISGYNTAHMASVIIRQGGKTLLVQGFELGSVNLASFLRSITGFNFNSIALLNQDLETALLISPVTLPNVQLTGDKLSGISATRGVSVQATMQFPDDCSSDAFCAVAQFLLGEDAQLNLQGNIASATSFALIAGVSNINLGSGIVMSEAGVEIRGGTTNSVGIIGAVDLSNPDITLAARVFLSTSGVVLEMTMSGCWENAFGANFLDICNLYSSVAMIPGLTLTGLALGGEVHVGDDTCGTPLVATGFVGIDVLTPTQNYYYVNIEGSTTVGTILDAFCINTNIPAPLAESGFPNGFMSSFSLAGVELPHVPLSIPQGYRLNGTLNILGLEASADVTVGLPNGIDFAVALPPINVGGLLRMYASRSDRSQGPFLTADIDLLPVPSVDIQANGYLSVLGISLETSLTITNTQYIFDIQGKMLNLFDANLHIASSYGNIQQATFTVQGSFTNNLYDVIENQIKNALDSAGKEASAELEAAQRELDRVRGVLDGANSALSAGRDEVNSAQSAFDSAVAEVARLRREVDSICSIKRCSSGKLSDAIGHDKHILCIRNQGLFCPTVCVGCTDGVTCCGKAWGKCVCYRPAWNSCCTRVPDPACEAENTACLALKEPIELALRGAEELVDSTRSTLDAAKAALVPLEAAVDAAQLTVDGAEETLRGVQAAFAVGLQAANAIANFGLNGLVSIREISFNARLDVAAGGSFSGSVRAVFAGAAETTVSFDVNLYDITSMARQLAEHIGSGFSSLF